MGEEAKLPAEDWSIFHPIFTAVSGAVLQLTADTASNDRKYSGFTIKQLDNVDRFLGMSSLRSAERAMGNAERYLGNHSSTYLTVYELLAYGRDGETRTVDMQRMKEVYQSFNQFQAYESEFRETFSHLINDDPDYIGGSASDLPFDFIVDVEFTKGYNGLSYRDVSDIRYYGPYYAAKR